MNSAFGWTPVEWPRFDGGRNTTNSPMSLQENELEDCNNMIPDSRGSIRKVPGREAYTANESAGDAVVAEYEFRMKDGTIHKLRVRGATIQLYNSTTDSWDNKTGTCAITNDQDIKWRFADLSGYVLGTNGTDPVIYWDGGAGDFQTLSGADIPTAANNIAAWQNRIWLVGITEQDDGLYYPMRIRSSTNGNPLVWNQESGQEFMDVDGASGGRELVKAFPDYRNRMFLFASPTGVYMETYDAAQTAWSAKLQSTIITHEWGTLSGDSVAQISTIFIFFADDGKLKGWDNRDLDRPRLIEVAGRDKEFFDAVDKDRAAQTCGTFVKSLRQYWFACTKDPVNVTTYNNAVLAVQIYGDIRVDDPQAEDKFSSWPLIGRRINCFGKYDQGVDGFRVVSGDDRGYSYLEAEGDNDNGAAINGWATTRLHDAGLPGMEKEWKRMILYFKAIGSHEVNVQVFDEQSQLLKTNQISIGRAADYWDQADWDDAYWDGGRVQRAVFNIDGWSEQIQIRLGNNLADEPYELLKAIVYFNKVREVAAGKDLLAS